MLDRQINRGVATTIWRKPCMQRQHSQGTREEKRPPKPVKRSLLCLLPLSTRLCGTCVYRLSWQTRRKSRWSEDTGWPQWKLAHEHTDADTQTKIQTLTSDGVVLTVAADDSHHISVRPTLCEPCECVFWSRFIMVIAVRGGSNSLAPPAIICLPLAR